MKSIKASSTNQRNKKEALYQCPVTYTLDKIGGRWKPLILFHLKNEKKRYNELKKALPLISEKMLIQQLKDLEQDGLVTRISYPVVPPKVEYQLTKHGAQLSPVLDAMAQWGLQFI